MDSVNVLHKNSLSIGIKSPIQITEISQSRNIFSIVYCAIINCLQCTHAVAKNAILARSLVKKVSKLMLKLFWPTKLLDFFTQGRP